MIRKIQNITQWDVDRDFINSTTSDIHNLGKSSRKTESNYEILKLLSDEMIKYKVSNIPDLIDLKRGKIKKDNKNPTDYSKMYGIVYYSHDRYVLVDLNKESFHILSWHTLKEDIKNKIFDLGYPVIIKNVINAIFNFYDEKTAIRIIKSIIDKDYILVDLRGKMIYKEITEKDYLGDDIGNRNCWFYMEKSDWYKFISDNLDEEKLKKLKPKIIKVFNDPEIKIRFIWAITEQILGETKTKQFFEENNLILRTNNREEPNTDRKYLLNIGEKVKKEYAN